MSANYYGGYKIKSWGSRETISSEVTNDDSEIISENNADVGPLMQSLFEKQMYTDVTFTAMNCSNSISAHRVIVAAKSSYLAELLFDEKKADNDVMVKQVDVTNITFDAVESIVKYMYTDDITFENDRFAMEVFAGAKAFKIQPLIEQCESYIESIDLTERNVCSLLQLAKLRKTVELEKRCITYIQENTSQVISSEDFNTSTYSTVQRICKLQPLNIKSEIQLLNAVMRWINVQSSQVKQQFTKSLLKCIRFLTFTPQELSSIMKKYPDLLTADDGLKLLMYLNDPQRTSIFPEWCNKNNTHRCITAKPAKQMPKKGFSKIIIPLSSSTEHQEEITELTSFLQMKCVAGRFKIHAIKFCFSDLVRHENMDVVIEIKVRVSPGKLSFKETFRILNNRRIFFFRVPVIVQQNDVVHIEAKGNGIQRCKFFQFNESDCSHEKNHFRCCLSSKPTCNKLFFISEVEYSRYFPSRSSLLKQQQNTVIKVKGK